jgi:hypothetical protein
MHDCDKLLGNAVANTPDSVFVNPKHPFDKLVTAETQLRLVWFFWGFNAFIIATGATDAADVSAPTTKHCRVCGTATSVRTLLIDTAYLAPLFCHVMRRCRIRSILFINQRDQFIHAGLQLIQAAFPVCNPGLQIVSVESTAFQHDIAVHAKDNLSSILSKSGASCVVR